MNKLDLLLAKLVARYADQLGLSHDLREQMIKEIAICVNCGYNSRAELITVVKKAMAA